MKKTQNPPNIVIIGGGSFSWGPQFIRDIAITPELSNCSIVLHDINPEPLDLVYDLGQKIISATNSHQVLTKTLDLEKALEGADFIVLTITTGGLEAMRHDLEIPERYGVFHSVGDTVGPGGLARSLRNVPVVVDIGKKIEAICPDAWLLNYTNPMTTLCRAITQQTSVKTIGLCHEYLGVRHHLAGLFKVRPDEIQARVGGINHLTWILDLKVNGVDSLPKFAKLAEEILAGKILVDADDPSSFADHFKVKSTLFQLYGALPAAGDRHIAEFFPFFLTQTTGKGKQYGIVRTPVKERYQLMVDGKAFIQGLLDDTVSIEPHLQKPCGEAAAQIILALRGGPAYTGPMNLPNQGQIANLPEAVVVETFATVDAAGVHPIHFGALPPAVESVVRRHIDNQELTVHAALTGNRQTALRVLINDPMISNLAQAGAMLDELLNANRHYLPRFFNNVTTP